MKVNQTFSPSPTYLSIQQALIYLDLSEPSFRVLINSHQIPKYYLGGYKVAYKASDLDRLLFTTECRTKRGKASPSHPLYEKPAVSPEGNRTVSRAVAKPIKASKRVTERGNVAKRGGVAAWL